MIGDKASFNELECKSIDVDDTYTDLLRSVCRGLASLYKS